MRLNTLAKRNLFFFRKSGNGPNYDSLVSALLAEQVPLFCSMNYLEVYCNHEFHPNKAVFCCCSFGRRDEKKSPSPPVGTPRCTVPRSQHSLTRSTATVRGSDARRSGDSVAVGRSVGSRCLQPEGHSIPCHIIKSFIVVPPGAIV